METHARPIAIPTNTGMHRAAPLAGRTIAVPESRELETLARMLEDEGAAVVRCPMVAILDAPDPRPSMAWLHSLVEGRFDDTIWLTGEGVQRLARLAANAGMRNAFMAALQRTRMITRGPKPAKALTALGLRPNMSTKIHTTEGILELFEEEDLQGRYMGVQLYGENPNLLLQAFLRNKGARVETVAPYIYAPNSDESRVLDLISRLSAYEVDAMAFTSASQFHRLQEIAKAKDQEAALLKGLAHTVVAAVGPVIARELGTCGVRVDIVPEHSYFMRPLVNQIARFFVSVNG